MYSIVGGGIAGLTTALAFEKMGIEYQLFESAEKLLPIGSGILLTPNALNVLQWLGVLQDIEQDGSPMKRITLTKPDLSPLFDYQQDDVKEIYGHYTISIHRWKLQNILLQRIPKSKIYLGKSITAFKQTKDHVLMHFEDGTSSSTTYLLGADGIHSRIRQLLFPESRLRYAGQSCWRGLCTLPQNLAEPYNYRGIEMWGDEVRFGISKIEENRFYWFAVILSEPNKKDIPGKIKERLSTIFKNFHPIVNELICATEEQHIIRSDLYDLKMLKKWYSNRVCLLGDAAHATTPNMGQGGAQAIEDAYYLANVINGNSPKNVYKDFQSLRKRKVTKIVRRSWIMGQIGHWQRISGLRNLILKLAPKSLLRKEWRTIYELK